MSEGTVLAEQHDEWAEGRRYLGLDVLARSQTNPAADSTDRLAASETERLALEGAAA